MAGAVVALVVTTPGAAQPAQSGAEGAAAALDAHTLDKRTGGVLRDLQLGQPEREAQVRRVLETHFQALQAWHAENDVRLAELWQQWAAARSSGNKDEARAEEFGRQIDAVYDSFRSRHDAFLRELRTSLSPREVEAVKDSLTKSPGLERTYHAYLQIVPDLTDAQKAFIRGRLEIAREDAMDAITNKEKADLFKRQKVKIEAFIEANGYDWRTLYKAYADRLRAEAEAKKVNKR